MSKVPASTKGPAEFEGRSVARAGASANAPEGKRELLARNYERARAVRRRALLWQAAVFVALPTIIAAIYFGIVAADIYYTEARFSVRSADARPSPQGLLGAFTNFAQFRQSNSDVSGVAEFMVSHDAVGKLSKRIDLRAILSRPEADFIRRLDPNAPFEEVVEHFRGLVSAHADAATGVGVLEVKAFRPGDAKLLAETLLDIGEELVNSLNRRAEEDALRVAHSELERTQHKVTAVRQKLSAFRAMTEELDPSQRSSSILGIVAALEKEYAETSAKLKEVSTFMRPGTVPIETLQQRLDALRVQIGVEQKRLTEGQDAFAEKLADYEALLVERDLANKEYASALGSLEAARLTAQRQQSYVATMVAPHLAEQAEYPKRLKSTALVFICACLVFAIGKIIVAGIRDHVVN